VGEAGEGSDRWSISWFVLIHVLSAIVALGANVGYVFWLDFADRKRSHLDFAIGGIERMDRIVTGPPILSYCYRGSC